MKKQTKKVVAKKAAVKSAIKKAVAQRAQPTVKAQMKKATGISPEVLAAAVEKLRAEMTPAPTKPTEKPKAANIFRTLIVRGLTRELNASLKEDGLTYSWTHRCWHKTGTDSDLGKLVKKYGSDTVTCEVQRDAIKDEGTNPIAFRGLPAKRAPKQTPAQRRTQFQKGRNHLRDAAKSNEAKTDAVKQLLGNDGLSLLAKLLEAAAQKTA